MKKLIILAATLVTVLVGICLYYFDLMQVGPVIQNTVKSIPGADKTNTSKKGRTVSGAVKEFGEKTDLQLAPYFAKAGVAFPPAKLTFIALKEEKQLEVWAEKDNRWIHIKTYGVKAASGSSGPKLQEGDRQVPEGMYKIEGLNPNSNFHLSLKVNYPNEFDLLQAKAEGRQQLGGDIFIEEIFVLTERVGKNNVSVIIAPRDFRKNKPAGDSGKEWVNNLYASIDANLEPFR